MVYFFDTMLRDGIEAWISLKEEDMAKFEADEELLTYVSPSKRLFKAVLKDKCITRRSKL